ncbi:MAG: hypothetical protein V4515_04780 [Chloroflexota bacterium]
MNRLAREHGLGIAIVVGLALLAAGLYWQRLDALIPGIALTLIGVVAKPIEEFTLNRSGLTLKWQREAAEKIVERVGSFRATGSRTVTVGATAGHAAGTGQAHDATVRTVSGQSAAEITRPQTPDEFAESVVKAIEPIIIRPDPVKLELRTSAPDVRVGPPASDPSD